VISTLAQVAGVGLGVTASAAATVSWLYSNVLIRPNSYPDTATPFVYINTEVDTPLGPAPAWFISGYSDTWVISVHGRGGSRSSVLPILPLMRHLGLPVLAISYRNDGEAPDSPDGRDHLGDTEWEDLAAAVRFAHDNGAEQVVLYGISMGTAIIGAFLDRAPEAKLVAAVIWDAPLVDWRATLRQQAKARRLPVFTATLAAWVTSWRIGIDFDRFDLIRNPPAVQPPTLMLHTLRDDVVSADATRELAAAGLSWPLEYVEIDAVGHCVWDPEVTVWAMLRFLQKTLGALDAVSGQH